METLGTIAGIAYNPRPFIRANPLGVGLGVAYPLAKSAYRYWKVRRNYARNYIQREGNRRPDHHSNELPTKGGLRGTMRLRSGRRTSRRSSVLRRRSGRRTSLRRRRASSAIRRVVLNVQESKCFFRQTVKVTDPTEQMTQVVGNQILQGDQYGNRSGSKLKVTMQKVWFNAYNEVTGVTGNGWVRLLCLRRKQPNIGTDIQLFKSETAEITGRNPAGADLSDIFDPINPALYSVHFDRRFRLLPKNLETEGRNTVAKKYNVKFNKTMQFNDNDLVSQDIMPNYIWCAFIRWDDLGIINAVNLELKTWTYFKDL